MDPLEVTAWATSASAVGVLISAFAASRAAKAAKEAVEVQASAALLGAIPLVVPWLEGDGNAKAINRGQSEAFNVSWTIEGPDFPTVEDARDTVLRPGAWAGLNDPRTAQKTHFAAARKGGGLTMTCRFAAAWGEEFSVVRHVKDKQEPAVLYDQNGKRIRIAV